MPLPPSVHLDLWIYLQGLCVGGEGRHPGAQPSTRVMLGWSCCGELEDLGTLRP